MSGKINVIFEDGKLAFLKVVENLGYNHDAGAYCKIVEYEGREMLVKRPQGLRLWRPHTARERVQPLIDHLERIKRHKEGCPSGDFGPCNCVTSPLSSKD